MCCTIASLKPYIAASVTALISKVVWRIICRLMVSLFQFNVMSLKYRTRGPLGLFILFCLYFIFTLKKTPTHPSLHYPLDAINMTSFIQSHIQSLQTPSSTSDQLIYKVFQYQFKPIRIYFLSLGQHDIAPFTCTNIVYLAPTSLSPSHQSS